jgi:phosphatidylglycerophosphate synthase
MDHEDHLIAQQLEDQEMVDRKFADRVAAWFDGIGTTPNRLTIGRVLLSLPMCLCFTLAVAHINTFAYWLFWLIAGSTLYTWAALLDAFDGALARYQTRKDYVKKLSEDDEYALSFWNRLNLRGSTNFGEVLDPFSDKVMYFSALFPLGWHVVDHLYLWLSLLVALILTLIRFRAIRRALEFGGKGAANRFGKYKIWVEVIAIASLVLLPNGPFKIMCANTAIGTALVIGMLSLTGHAWLGVKKAAALRKAATARKRMALHLVH